MWLCNGFLYTVSPMQILNHPPACETCSQIVHTDTVHYVTNRYTQGEFSGILTDIWIFCTSECANIFMLEYKEFNKGVDILWDE